MNWLLRELQSPLLQQFLNQLKKLTTSRRLAFMLLKSFFVDKIPHRLIPCILSKRFCVPTFHCLNVETKLHFFGSRFQSVFCQQFGRTLNCFRRAKCLDMVPTANTSTSSTFYYEADAKIAENRRHEVPLRSHWPVPLLNFNIT